MPSALKEARLESRATREQRALIERAAASLGMTVSEFVLHESLRSARRVIEQERLLQLSSDDYMRLIKQLDEPAELSRNLKQAWKENRQLISSVSLPPIQAPARDVATRSRAPKRKSR